MKKWIALMLALVLTLLCFGANAQKVEITGPRGPELPSTFEVEEEAGLSVGVMNEEQTQATMGTEVYLYVDPDTANYVTFVVVNAENGARLAGAVIEIEYKGVKAVYGVTDHRGECKVYLFRNVKYNFTVTCEGYEPASGHFTSTGKTQTVRIALRPYHRLTVIVKENGKPRPGIAVYLENERCLTNAEGKAFFRNVTGTYSIRVYLPNDGGVIYRRVYLNQDMTIVIHLDEYRAPKEEAEYGYNFLVYNRLYEPEDYVLTRWVHKAVDVIKKNGETDQEWKLRAEEYLAQNPNVIVVEAQPDREQLDEGDLNLTDANGKPLYAQRSMMPSGTLLREWEAAGFAQTIFANEFAAIGFDLADLHGQEMTKAFALARMLSENGSWADVAIDGVTDSDLPALTHDVDAAKIDWSLIRSFEFPFDHVNEAADTPNRSSHELLRDDCFFNTVFEFRITPVVPQELEKALQLAAEPKETDETVIELAGEGTEAQRVDDTKALGRVTEDEAASLHEWFAETQADGKLYRVNVWIIHEGVEMDVTSLIPSLKVLWAADQKVLDEQQPRTMAVMDATLTPVKDALTTLRALPDKEDVHYSVLSRRAYERLTVDVRKVKDEFRSYTTASTIVRSQSFARQADVRSNALVWVEK